ncbi:hypothetical protein GOODEAATRI_013272 [Goodea atripinnis]|uniref:Uncharacterized protein n=1 Tax=Goodea atripinnis TaxID=208336 RepID=A0ABV0PXM6_9TELE
MRRRCGAQALGESFSPNTLQRKRQRTFLFVHPLSGLVPVHGAPQGSLPALEDGDVFLTWPGSAPLSSTFRQEHLISVLQLLQLFTGCPEPYSDSPKLT